MFSAKCPIIDGLMVVRAPPLDLLILSSQTVDVACILGSRQDLIELSVKFSEFFTRPI
jgi:hypothetical protein